MPQSRTFPASPDHMMMTAAVARSIPAHIAQCAQNLFPQLQTPHPSKQGNTRHLTHDLLTRDRPWDRNTRILRELA